MPFGVFADIVLNNVVLAPSSEPTCDATQSDARTAHRFSALSSFDGRCSQFTHRHYVRTFDKAKAQRVTDYFDV